MFYVKYSILYHAIENTAVESRCIFYGIARNLPIMRRAYGKMTLIVLATLYFLWHGIKNIIEIASESCVSYLFTPWKFCCGYYRR